ncbi:UNKNOWN [Stylonychia lemnae]|uniref:Uncharacterized protein n=1 Tax=Stylonychia lemnae TaxID=5949 RepID=A0A078A4L7_STYLE|nr:UNKNOWN [Stylonychia lemnae]|eukprot:CDW76834.1 UNKNOWN [Stylonychia lemnae]
MNAPFSPVSSQSKPLNIIKQLRFKAAQRKIELEKAWQNLNLDQQKNESELLNDLVESDSECDESKSQLKETDHMKQTCKIKRSNILTPLNIKITKQILDVDRARSALLGGKRFKDFLKDDEKKRSVLYQENIDKNKLLRSQSKILNTVVSLPSLKFSKFRKE